MTELKLKYKEIYNKPQAKGDQPKNKQVKSKDIEFYDNSTNAHNICFVPLNGMRTFLNYSHLISGVFMQEESVIILNFTTHKVTIQGNNLDFLFDSILVHQTKQIRSSLSRYLIAEDDSKPFVTEIQLFTNIYDVK